MEENNAGRFRLLISLSTEHKKDSVNNEIMMGGKGLTIDEISDFFKNILHHLQHETPTKATENN